ncbi:MAG: GNAT family N-acetyltransferase [Actinomycetota bacterium]
MTMMETQRLRLVPFGLAHAAALERGPSELAAFLGVDVPEGWPRFPEAYTTENFQGPNLARDNDMSSTPWGSYLFLHRLRPLLVGSGGFKGEPVDGEVEFGYEIAPEFENQGFATEAAKAMIAEAFSHPAVEFVLAHTLPERNASTVVLEKAGLDFVGSIDDPDDGTVWRWRLSRTGAQADSE